MIYIYIYICIYVYIYINLWVMKLVKPSFLSNMFFLMSESQRASRHGLHSSAEGGCAHGQTAAEGSAAGQSGAKQRRARAEKMRRSMVFSVGIYFPVIKSLG